MEGEKNYLIFHFLSLSNLISFSLILFFPFFFPSYLVSFYKKNTWVKCWHFSDPLSPLLFSLLAGTLFPFFFVWYLFFDP